MAQGQSIGDAVMNTFKEDGKAIAVSAGVGAVTGALGGGVGTAIAKQAGSTFAKQTAQTVATNTVLGGAGAVVEDVATKAVNGEEQNLGDSLRAGVGGAVTGGIISGVGQGIRSQGTTTFSRVMNLRGSEQVVGTKTRPLAEGIATATENVLGFEESARSGYMDGRSQCNVTEDVATTPQE